MALSDKMEAAFNDQITSELAASLTYRQMAAFLEADERPGMANWMRRQSAEEADHADTFIEHVLARGGHVAIGAIPAPPASFAGPVEVFAAALDQERLVTAQIRALYELAKDNQDLESLPLLHDFLIEQVHEEDAVEGIVQRMRRVADSEPGLLMIDVELASRGAAAE